MLIGAGVLGVIGFFVLSSLTIVGGIAGGVVVGVGVGRMAGKCLKRKLNLSKLDLGLVVRIRVNAMLKWAKNNRKKLDVPQFSSVLQKLLFQSKQCQQIDTKNPKKVQQALLQVRKFLLSKKSQIALLYYTGKLEQQINEADQEDPEQCKRLIYQILFLLIPLLRLLQLKKNKKKNYNYKDLEIYQRCVRLIHDPCVINLLQLFIKDQNIDISLQNVAQNQALNKTFCVQAFKSPQNNKRNVSHQIIDDSMISPQNLHNHSQIQDMLHNLVNNAEIINPIEKRLNNQILNNAMNEEAKRMIRKRRNSNPAELIKISDAIQKRQLKQIDKRKKIRKEIMTQQGIISLDQLKIQLIDDQDAVSPKHKKPIRSSMISIPALYGDIYQDVDQVEEDEELHKQEQEDEEKEQQKQELEDEQYKNQGEKKYFEQVSCKVSQNSLQATDQFSKLSPEIRYDFSKLISISEEMDQSWSRVLKDQVITVYRKKIKNQKNILIKSFSLLRGIRAQTAIQAIIDTKSRIKWDKLFDTLQSVDDEEDNRISILYYKIQTPLGITQRDFLQRRTMLNNYPKPGMTTLHFKSIQDDRFPPAKKIIRAQTIISGYIFEQIEPGTQFYIQKMGRCPNLPPDTPLTTLTIVSQNDIKGLIPKWLVNKVSASAPRSWVKNFSKACHQIAGTEMVAPPPKQKKKDKKK